MNILKYSRHLQVEHQHCCRTDRVQKNHNILRKNTLFNEHPVAAWLLTRHEPDICWPSCYQYLPTNPPTCKETWTRTIHKLWIRDCLKISGWWQSSCFYDVWLSIPCASVKWLLQIAYPFVQYDKYQHWVPIALYLWVPQIPVLLHYVKLLPAFHTWWGF